MTLALAMSFRLLLIRELRVLQEEFDEDCFGLPGTFKGQHYQSAYLSYGVEDPSLTAWNLHSVVALTRGRSVGARETRSLVLH